MFGMTPRSATGLTALPAARRLKFVLMMVLCILSGTALAQPPIEIWLGRGIGRFGDVTFNVLGGKKTHPTPKGTFTVKAKHKDFYSRKYKAPMPLSIFFTSQCAIHVGSLRQKSHGCLHVDWETAEFLFHYARPGKTKVKIYP